MRAYEFITETWSEKYKRSINCSNPKGFSQRAHCQGRKKDEDQHPNDTPRGPEVKPTMPAGTVIVDVSDVYDWYKLGKNIANLKQANPKDFGKGPPSTIMAFGSEEEEHKYISALKKLGLTTTDIDPLDPKQPKGIPRQKTDPTYNVNEFAVDDSDSGEEDILRKFARMWYNGDDAVRQKVERALDRQGWEIGEIESEEGGTFVVRSGDEHGNSYIGFAPEDLSEGSLNEFAPGGNSASSYYAVTENFINEFTQQKQEELQDLIDAGWTKKDLAQAGTLKGHAADIAHLEQVRDSFLKGLKPGFNAYLQGDTQMKDQLGAYWMENDLPLNQDWEKIYGEPWGDDSDF